MLLHDTEDYKNNFKHSSQMINALSPCLCSHDPLSKKLLNFKTAPLCESPPILFILTHLSFI